MNKYLSICVYFSYYITLTMSLEGFFNNNKFEINFIFFLFVKKSVSAIVH